MSSWRDTASDIAQRDLDELLGTCLGFAQQQLAEHGEFFPYAAAIRLDGRVEMVASRPELTSERPESAAVIASCEATLTEMREELRATAVVADVRTSSGDGIQVNLEHVEGSTLVVLLPYSRRRFRTVKYGQLSAASGIPHIWSR
jgi:hypothetical protein